MKELFVDKHPPTPTMTLKFDCAAFNDKRKRSVRSTGNGSQWTNADCADKPQNHFIGA
jgi:hypothetical protein